MAQIRIKLEIEGIRHAAVNFGEAEFDHISRLFSSMDEAAEADDQYTISELDRKLHMCIFRASGLVTLEPIMMRCALHLHLYTFGNPEPPGEKQPPSVAHQPILNALAAHDPDSAAQAMQAHIAKVIETWAPPLHAALK